MRIVLCLTILFTYHYLIALDLSFAEKSSAESNGAAAEVNIDEIEKDIKRFNETIKMIQAVKS